MIQSSPYCPTLSSLSKMTTIRWRLIHVQLLGFGREGKMKLSPVCTGQSSLCLDTWHEEQGLSKDHIYQKQVVKQEADNIIYSLCNRRKPFIISEKIQNRFPVKGTRRETNHWESGRGSRPWIMLPGWRCHLACCYGSGLACQTWSTNLRGRYHGVTFCRRR